MNSPLEKPKHIKQLQLSADKNPVFPSALYATALIFMQSNFCIPFLSPVLCPSCSVLHWHGFWDYSLIYQFNHYPYFLDQYLSCKLTPKIFLLHFCLILKSVTLIPMDFPATDAFPFKFVTVLAEQLLYSKSNSVPHTFSTPSTQSAKLSITDGCFSSNYCRCTPSPQRSRLYPMYLSFLPHLCLWPKQVYSKY